MKKSTIKKFVSLAFVSAIAFSSISATVYENGTSNLLSTSVTTVSAAANGTGTYKVNTSSGLNVRSSASTSGSKVGAAANGVQFSVTQISGSWGYTPSIQTTSGTKSGWVSLDYCQKIGTNWAKVGNGAYILRPACASWKSLDVAGGGTGNGSNIHLWEYLNQSNQQVELINNSDGSVTLKDRNSGKAYDFNGGTASNGVNLQIWDCNGTNAQKFFLKDEGNGYYSIHSVVNTNYVIDVNGGSSSNGTNCTAWEYNGSNAQKFKLEPVSQSNNNVPGYMFPLKGSITRSSNVKTSGVYCDYKAESGTPVYAPADGTVTFKQTYATSNGKLASYGNNFDFKSSDGVLYVKAAHLSKFNGVNLKITSSNSYPCSASNYNCTTNTLATKSVKKGDIIGYSGMTGNASGPHLHLEIKKNGAVVSPSDVFKTW